MNDIETLAAAETPTAETLLPDYPERLRKWFDWCEEYPFLRMLTDEPWNQRPPPKPLDRKALGALVAVLLSDQHRPFLQELLIDLLGEGIETIVLAVLRRELE